jgi:cobalt/nickel transport system permease protein
MMDERFARGNSLLHRTSPRIKVVTATLFVATVALSSSLLVVAVASFFSVILLVSARLDGRSVAKRLLAANSFTLFIWLTLPVTYGGPALASLGPFSISAQGVALCMLISLKTNAIIMALMALLSTSTIAAIGHALESLHLPRRLCFLLLFSYRYLFVINDEYQKLRRAAQLRCFRPATSVHTYKTVGYLFGMTLVRSWNRSSRIHQAMLLRGFDGRLIPLGRDTVSAKDIAFLLTFLIIIAGLLALPALLPAL